MYIPNITISDENYSNAMNNEHQNANQPANQKTEAQKTTKTTKVERKTHINI